MNIIVFDYVHALNIIDSLDPHCKTDAPIIYICHIDD